MWRLKAIKGIYEAGRDDHIGEDNKPVPNSGWPRWKAAINAVVAPFIFHGDGRPKHKKLVKFFWGL